MSKFSIRILGEVGQCQEQTVKILNVEAEVKVYTHFSCRLIFICEDVNETHPIPAPTGQQASYLYVCLRFLVWLWILPKLTSFSTSKYQQQVFKISFWPHFSPCEMISIFINKVPNLAHSCASAGVKEGACIKWCPTLALSIQLIKSCTYLKRTIAAFQQLFAFQFPSLAKTKCILEGTVSFQTNWRTGNRHQGGLRRAQLCLCRWDWHPQVVRATEHLYRTPGQCKETACAIREGQK